MTLISNQPSRNIIASTRRSSILRLMTGRSIFAPSATRKSVLLQRRNDLSWSGLFSGLEKLGLVDRFPGLALVSSINIPANQISCVPWMILWKVPWTVGTWHRDVFAIRCEGRLFRGCKTKVPSEWTRLNIAATSKRDKEQRQRCMLWLACCGLYKCPS